MKLHEIKFEKLKKFTNMCMTPAILLQRLAMIQGGRSRIEVWLGGGWTTYTIIFAFRRNFDFWKKNLQNVKQNLRFRRLFFMEI